MIKKTFSALVKVILIIFISAVTCVATYRYVIKVGDGGDQQGSSQPMLSEANAYGFNDTAYQPSSLVSTDKPDLVQAAEKSVLAVVHIKVEGERSIQGGGMIDPFEFFFGGRRGTPQMQTQPVVAFGSGVIISSDGYIMTNNHVIESGEKISVTLNDNRSLPAKLVGTDPTTDIALLKIEGKDFPTIPFGNSDNIHLGEWVLAVGNPFNLTGTVTAGIISAKSRSTAQNTSGGLKVEAFIQTDAAVNSGNSGGALVNAQGELIGINTMIYSQTGNYAGYSFAVPINLAAKVVADIKQYGSVQRALLGVSGLNVNAELAKEKDLKVNQGVWVGDFAEISAAFAAGMEKGDVIISLNNHKIEDFAQLQEQIGRFRPGDKVNVRVNRKGKELDFVVTLKNQEGGKGVIKATKLSSKLGAEFEQLEAKQMRSYGLSYGLQVKKLSKGLLQTAGVKEGFIVLTANDRPIRSLKDLEKIMMMSKQNKQNILYLRGFYPNTGDVVGYPISIK